MHLGVGCGGRTEGESPLGVAQPRLVVLQQEVPGRSLGIRLVRRHREVDRERADGGLGGHRVAHVRRQGRQLVALHRTAEPTHDPPTAADQERGGGDQGGDRGDRLPDAETTAGQQAADPVDADGTGHDQSAEADQQQGHDTGPDLGCRRRQGDHCPGDDDRCGEADERSDEPGSDGAGVGPQQQADQGDEPDTAQDHGSDPQRRQPGATVPTEQELPGGRCRPSRAECGIRADQQATPVADDAGPPRDQHHQRDTQADADPADLARLTGHRRGQGHPTEDGQREQYRFEGDQYGERQAGTPGPSPRSFTAGAAQHQRAHGHDQQWQHHGDHCHREPTLVRPAEQHRQQRIRHGRPDADPSVLDQVTEHSVGRQQGQRNTAADQQGDQPVRLPGQHSRAQEQPALPGAAGQIGGAGHRGQVAVQQGEPAVRSRQQCWRGQCPGTEDGTRRSQAGDHGEHHGDQQWRDPRSTGLGAGEVVAGQLVDGGLRLVPGQPTLGQGGLDGVEADPPAVPPGRAERGHVGTALRRGRDGVDTLAQAGRTAPTADEAGQGTQFVGRPAGSLAQQETERPQQAAPDEADPPADASHAAAVGRHHRHAQLTVDGVRVRAGGALGTEPGPTGLQVRHLGPGRSGHPVTRESGPPTEFDAVPEDRHLRSQATEGVPDGTAHQHAAGGDAEGVAALVMLPLVQFARLEGQLASAGAGDRGTDLTDQLRSVVGDQHQLRSGDLDRGFPGDGEQQLLQRVRTHLGVVVQQPHPVVAGARFPAARLPAARLPAVRPPGARLLGARLLGGSEPVGDGGAESEVPVATDDRVDGAGSGCRTEQVGAPVGALVVDRDDLVRSTGQPGQ